MCAGNWRASSSTVHGDKHLEFSYSHAASIGWEALQSLYTVSLEGYAVRDLLLVESRCVRVTTRGTDTDRILSDALFFRPSMVRGRDDSNLGKCQ